NTRPAALTCTQQLPEKVMTSPPWLAAAGVAGAAAGALGAAVDGDAGAAGAGCTGADAAVSPAVAGSAGWAAALSPASAAGTVAPAAGSPRVSSVTGAPTFGSSSKDEERLSGGNIESTWTSSRVPGPAARLGVSRLSFHHHSPRKTMIRIIS